jgi:hypothetical protein
VSYVYLHAGTPFDKKGDIEMTLPRMDMPVGIVEWEVFAPERYSMKSIGGNAIERSNMRVSDGRDRRDRNREMSSGFSGRVIELAIDGGVAGQISGVAKDASGAVLPGVTIQVTSPALTEGVRTTATNNSGRFVFMNVPSGQISLLATLPGFSTARHDFFFDRRPRELTIEMRVGALEETVTVTAETPTVDTRNSARTMVFRNDADEQRRPRAEPAPIVPPSQNVVELQRRTTGVLPVRIDVPRAGTSHQFVKPLVIDQETTVKLRYKRR